MTLPTPDQIRSRQTAYLATEHWWKTRTAELYDILTDAIAAWQGEDDCEDGPHKRGRSAATRARLRARQLAVAADIARKVG